MTQKITVLVVDDEPLNLEIVADYLEDEFELITANNGKECLESASNNKPDLILLDVNMPVMDGIEACKKLKIADESKDIPIIFVSALASASERMDGYNAGADDYITKPFDADELSVKINLLIKSSEETKTANIAADYAYDTAMVSMTSASEAGIVLKFMQNVLTVNNISDLETHMGKTLKALGCDACVIATHNDEPEFLLFDKNSKPIEKDILLEVHLKNADKIISFSSRAIFNEKHVAILIRNMPEDDAKKGRYNDHLAILLDSVEGKLVQFMAEAEKQKHYEALTATIQKTFDRLEAVSVFYQKQRKDNAQILSDLIVDVEESFLTLGLDEQQEESFIGMVTAAEKKTDAVFEKGKESMKTFDEITGELKALL